jgi:predicted ATPase
MRGLPLRRRQRIHGQAALAMERLYGLQAGDLAAELAFHFQEGAAHDGQLQDKAIQYLLQAGDQARMAQAHHEAAGYYRQALTC